jgi:hypothetical protein
MVIVIPFNLVFGGGTDYHLVSGHAARYWRPPSVSTVILPAISSPLPNTEFAWCILVKCHEVDDIAHPAAREVLSSRALGAYGNS